MALRPVLWACRAAPRSPYASALTRWALDMSAEHPSTVADDVPIASGPSTDEAPPRFGRRFGWRVRSRGWRPWGRLVLDLLVAAGCAAFDVQVRSAFAVGEIYGLLPQSTYGWLAVLSAALLVARRRWPVAVAALVSCGLLLGTGSVLTVVVAYYSLARHTRALRTVCLSAAAGCAVVLGAAVLHVRRFAPHHGVAGADTVLVLAFVALAAVVLPVLAGLYPRVPRHPWWWEHRRAMLFDVLLVLLFPVTNPAVLLIGTGHSSGNVLWLPASVVFVLVVLQGLALIWRRRYPTVLAAACIAVTPFTLPSPAALPVGLYTLAKYGRSRRNLALACTAAVLTLIAWSAVANHFLAARFIPTSVFLVVSSVAVPVLLGMYRGAKRSLMVSLQERAERLEREQHLLAAQARMQERARIAREMHDIVSHRVSLMVVHAGALEAGAAGDNQVATDTGKLIGQMGRQALNELRQVLGVLRESDGNDQAPMTAQPTLEDVAVLVAESRAAGAHITFETASDAACVDSAAQATVYRLVQEGLTNARKHAPGAPVRVTLRHLPGTLKVVIDNDPPTGPTPAPLPSGGHGLSGLNERVTALGGTVSAAPRPDGGFRITATIPTPNEPRQ
ncbi:histidine kinase [Streptomyces sp. NPDC020096]